MMPWKYEAMSELYQVKDRYAAQFDYDLHAMVRDRKQKEVSEKRKGRRFVSFPPRRCRLEFPYTPLDEEAPGVPPVDMPTATTDNTTATE